MYLCVLCGSQNKQRLFPHITQTGFYNRDEECLLCGTHSVFKQKSTRVVFKQLTVGHTQFSVRYRLNVYIVCMRVSVTAVLWVMSVAAGFDPEPVDLSFS